VSLPVLVSRRERKASLSHRRPLTVAGDLHDICRLNVAHKAPSAVTLELICRSAADEYSLAAVPRTRGVVI